MIFKNDVEIAQKSYTKWAVHEILARLRENRDIPPAIVVEQFRDEMEQYSCLNSQTSFIFSVAKDAAEWMLDDILAK